MRSDQVQYVIGGAGSCLGTETLYFLMPVGLCKLSSVHRYIYDGKYLAEFVNVSPGC